MGGVCAWFAAGCCVIVSTIMKKVQGGIRGADVMLSSTFCECENLFSAACALFTFFDAPLRS
jgi:hypothetical protein